MNAPAWRIWLVTALTSGWGILTVRSWQKEDWLFVLLCGLMLAFNAMTLWQLTQKNR